VEATCKKGYSDDSSRFHKINSGYRLYNALSISSRFFLPSALRTIREMKTVLTVKSSC